MKRIKVVNQSQMSIVPVSVRSRTRIAASLHPSPAVNDEPVLSADEIKTFAKLIDVLMEADFEINRNERLVANAC